MRFESIYVGPPSGMYRAIPKLSGNVASGAGPVPSSVDRVEQAYAYRPGSLLTGACSHKETLERAGFDAFWLHRLVHHGQTSCLSLTTRCLRHRPASRWGFFLALF